ncbi:MAG: phosphatase PAP2 family protein [Alphaproteobacteria bacterium]|nr:phosphatase PAP2 family protein [Alphaproteobacteria bacterium]
MSSMRLVAIALFACSLAVPAFAQAPVPAETPDSTSVAVSEPATTHATAPAPAALQVPPLRPVSSTIFEEGNPFKLSATDFKKFFGAETAKTLAFASIFAIASAPWDREGVNNGFGIPTTVFESGNVIGSVIFQVGAGLATAGIGKATGNQKLGYAGRDIVRAQVLSQGIVQAIKFSARRERPDFSNNKSFPSGHSASMFSTATVLHRYYGWKVGVPAYALGGYVALARLAWNRHHASDVVMGAGFGIAAARTVTMSIGKSKFNLGVQPQAGGASVNFTKIYQ